MSYLPHLHICAWCGVYLGPDNGDGTCAKCDDLVVECCECGEWKMPDENCHVCLAYQKETDQ